MQQTIQAVYEHGVFVPSTPVNLPEHAKVTVRLRLHSGSKKASSTRFSALLQNPLIADSLEIPSREQRHER